MFKDAFRISPWGIPIIFLLFVAPYAKGLEPVALEPSEKLEAGVLEISEDAVYQYLNGSNFGLNSEIEYAITERLGLRLAAPVEWEEGESGEFGDLGLRLQLVLNPEAARWPVATLSAEAFAPTGRDSDSLGGELQLRLSKSLGADGRHALHFDVAGGHPTSDEEDARDLYYRVVAGYTYEAGESTTLYADFVRQQLARYGENSNLLEIGIRQKLNDTAAVALGVGAGLGEESPDWTVNAGLELRFDLHR